MENDYHQKWLSVRFNIFEPLNVFLNAFSGTSKIASLLKCIGRTPSEAKFLHETSFFEAWIFVQTEKAKQAILIHDLNADPSNGFQETNPVFQTWSSRLYDALDLLKSVRQGFVPSVTAPSIRMPWTPSEPDWMHHFLFGTRSLADLNPSSPFRTYFQRQELPLFWSIFRSFGSAPQSQMYALAKSLIDSGKMLKLDELLKTLKAGGHRILLFSQMTTMMNILEDYLSFRRYKYKCFLFFLKHVNF